RPVVRGGESVPDHERVMLSEHVSRESEVSQRLRHLLTSDGDQSIVEPIARELFAGGSRLRQFILMMREAQVETATVDVEGGSKVALRHGRALDVPARAAGSPGRLPGRISR